MDNRKKNGGVRKNSGRKAGTTNKDIQQTKDILEPFREQLILKAVEMALGEKNEHGIQIKPPDKQIMNKLLDKLLPNLTSVEAGSSIFPPIEVFIKDYE